MKSARTIYAALGRDPVHPFPARMAPEIVSRIIRSSKRPLRVLDPMAGSGTVVALAQHSSHKAYGIDIDPLAVLIGQVWTQPIDHRRVRLRAKAILKSAHLAISQLSAASAYPTTDPETRRFIRYWFDANARKQLTTLAAGISRTRNRQTQNVLWCAFSRLIIAKQAGASRALDLAHSRPHRFYPTAPAKPFAHFMSQVNHVLRNALDARGTHLPASINLGDARHLPIASKSIDLVLTSPPYLNAIDYIRCSKFSLVWMGYSVGELTMIRRSSVGAEVAKATSDDPELDKIVETLGLRDLSSRHLGIVRTYMDDMRRSITEIARVLVPGGKAIYVVGENTIRGKYVETAKIIRAIAMKRGLRVTSSRHRVLPPNRRYLPPPTVTANRLDARMRAEIVLHFAKKPGAA
jgi:DNA modification methylase